MEPPLVVGVDGSEPSLRATDWATDEAVRLGLPLRLVHASLWERYEGPSVAEGVRRPDERVLVERILTAAEERARRRAPDLAIECDILPEDTVGALLREGRLARALVTGARGRGGMAALLLGSVSLSVAARAACPVIVVRGDEASVAGTHGRVLLGVGDADVDSTAVRFAFREAEARDCVLDVVRAWRSPVLDAADHVLFGGEPARRHEEERARAVLDKALDIAVRAHPDVRVRRATPEGSVGKVLVARSATADLLVVGARRRQGLVGLQLGRGAHTALHHAACPVAVVPHDL
ncbi:universal stress protein [Streptomyces sp. NPDC047928]|uniref:universal stress protein n=1 Tax=unclassified Streptomyces TaxID=2593676 RepID=UPI003717E14F